jgi:hypothetical protein
MKPVIVARAMTSHEAAHRVLGDTEALRQVLRALTVRIRREGLAAGLDHDVRELAHAIGTQTPPARGGGSLLDEWLNDR